jgi:ribokinase
VLVSSHERNAAVFTFRGANTLLEPGDLRDEAFAVDLVYVSSLSNRSADCYPLIIEKAKASGALVAVNPGVRQLSARGGAFQDCLPQVDIRYRRLDNLIKKELISLVEIGTEALVYDIDKLR